MITQGIGGGGGGGGVSHDQSGHWGGGRESLQ